MISYQESLLLREIKRLKQELIGLKSPQRYLMGQVKGFVSNTLTINSRILSTSSSYEYRGILGWLKFTGDKPNKQVNAKIKFQLYDSSGNPISLSFSQGTKITLEAVQSSAGDNPNEMWFIVFFDTSDRIGTTDVFYGNFWVVANDSGILTYESDIQGPDYA